MYRITATSNDPFSKFADSGRVVTSGGLPAAESSGTDYLSKFLDFALLSQSQKNAAKIRDAQFEQDRLLKQIELDSNINASLLNLKLADVGGNNPSTYLVVGVAVLALAGLVWAVK